MALIKTIPALTFMLLSVATAEQAALATTTAASAVYYNFVDPYSAFINTLVPRFDGGPHILNRRCNDGDASCGNGECCIAPFSCISTNGAVGCRIGGTQAPTFVDLPTTPAYTESPSTTTTTSTDDTVASVSASAASAAASSVRASVQSVISNGGSVTGNPNTAISNAISSALATVTFTGPTTSSSSTTAGSAADGSAAGPRPAADNGNGSSISGGAIAGIVVGCVVGIALLILLLFFLVRQRKKAAVAPAGTGDMKEGAADMYSGSNVGQPPAYVGSGLPTGAATPLRQGKTELPAGADGEPRPEVEGSSPDVTAAQPAEYYEQEKDAGPLESGPFVGEKATPSGRSELPG